MALLSQSKTLAGSRAFSGLRARTSPVVSNGSRVTMKRKDSYMVEVNVGEDEPEDIAVRKFMKKVMESGVIEELRNRRYKETPLQEWKRRTKQRIAARKMGIRLPTWEEEYGIDPEVKPFDEFYQRDPDNTSSFVDSFLQYRLSDGAGYLDWDQNVGGSYMAPMGSYMAPMGSYMAPMGSYMAPEQAGGYAQVGGSYAQPGGGFAQSGGGYMTGPQDAGAYTVYTPFAPAVDAYGNPIYTDPAYMQPEYQQQQQQQVYQEPMYPQPPQQQQ